MKPSKKLLLKRWRIGKTPGPSTKTIVLFKKILATIFTAAYFVLSYVMFKYFVLHDVVLSEYEIGFISTIFGAMSAKVNTIVDFFLWGQQ